MDYTIKRYKQHKAWIEWPALQNTHTIIHIHIVAQTQTHPLHTHLLLEGTGERKEKPNSHDTAKGFLRYASSCAHPGLASGWRLCCTWSTCMASAVNEKRSPWIWVNSEPSSLRYTRGDIFPSFCRVLQQIQSCAMSYFILIFQEKQQHSVSAWQTELLAHDSS